MTTCSKSKLLTLIEGHLDTAVAAPSTFGKAALGEAGFVFRLRKGARPRDATVHRVLDYMIGYVEELLVAEEECAAIGVGLVSRTMLIPVPIPQPGQSNRFVAGRYA